MHTPLNVEAVTKTFNLQANIAREFVELVNLDADQAASLCRWMNTLVGDTGREVQVRVVAANKSTEQEETNFDAVARVFVKNDNQPINKIEIGAKSGVGASSLHTLIYTSHPKKFERTPNPSGGKHKLICLTQVAYDEAKAKFAD